MLVVATAGHVDHGKSTLVRAVTGTDPDRWAEEHRRGLTIDLGFAWADLPNGETIAFVDVPGHERFVRNMLAGLGELGVVVFVVAADEGWMPQSEEHLQAIDALDIRHGLLVVTRCDLADPEIAERQARDRLRHTSLAEVDTVRVSSTTGGGLDRFRDALGELARTIARPDPDRDVRLWLDRSFTIRGAGTVVTGTLGAGTLSRDQPMELAASRTAVSVRELQTLGRSVDEVSGNARVAVNLRGARYDRIERGDALITPGAWLSTDLIEVRLRGASTRELPQRLTLHIGSIAVPARVRPLGTDTARLTLDRGLPLRIGDRGLLRDPGKHRVPAGVLVLDIRPPPLRRRGAAAGRGRELAEAPHPPDGHTQLRTHGSLRARQLRAMGAPVPSDAPRSGDWLMDPELRDELAERLGRMLTEHERQHPLAGGMTHAAARRALDLPDARLLDVVLAAPNAPTVIRNGARLSTPHGGPPEQVRRSVDAVRSLLSRRPFDAPTAGELDELGIDTAELDAAVREGELIKPARGVYLTPEALDRAVDVLSELSEPFTPAEARKALGTSRRVAVPLLELLARHGRTIRLADDTHRLR